MIISASRRTDIPSYYGEWFVHALKRGYVLVPNPYNKQRYYRADLRREAVDCIVFWTKNPLPFLKYLPTIDALGYPYYFQFTITPYNKNVERNIPDKIRLLKAFQTMSLQLGSHKMIWRYDPIMIDNVFTIEYHKKAFEYMARALSGHTDRCIISFVDIYKNMQSRLGYTPKYSVAHDMMNEIADIFSSVGCEYGVKLYTCSEKNDLSAYGVHASSCIDREIIENILGYALDVSRDKHQRAECQCVESIEIGTYNSCANGCSYCYALSSDERGQRNVRAHDPQSSLLVGSLPEDAIITQRPNHSVVRRQLSLL